MVHSVWSSEMDILKIRQQIYNVIKGFFAEFPDQESPLAYKQVILYKINIFNKKEYVDLAIFLLLFGSESSAWRLMKEIYGIIIPIESISHITNNDFNYGEKYLMNFLLDKINYEFGSDECSNIYRFVQDRGIEFINSFFTNQTNFQTSYQIFNHVINMPYNRRWSELLRSLGVYIIENKDIIGQLYQKIVWDEMKQELNINTKWKRMKEKMDVYCYFQIADQRQMSRFSMVDDVSQQEMDQLQPSTEDIIEENKMLKKEKMDELDDMRMELQKRELIRQKYEENLKKQEEMQRYELQNSNSNLQEQFKRISYSLSNSGIQVPDIQKKSASLVNPPYDQNLQQQGNNSPIKKGLHEDEFLQAVLKDKEKIAGNSQMDSQQQKNANNNDQDNQVSQHQNEHLDIAVNTKIQNPNHNENCNLNDKNEGDLQNNSDKQMRQSLLQSAASDQERLSILQKEIEELEHKNKILCSKADQYMSQFISQGDQILKQKLDIQKKEGEIEMLKQNLQHQKIGHAASIESLEKQLNDCKTNYEKQIEHLKDQNKIVEIEQNLKAEITSQNQKIEKLNLYNQILQSEKTELFLQKQNLTQQVNSLQQQTSSSNQNNDSNINQSEIDDLRNTITKLQLELKLSKENSSQ